MMYNSPNSGGFRPETRGVIIHSTRGGAASAKLEWLGTVRWFMSPASEVSAHFLIDEAGKVDQFVAIQRIAWHAGAEANESYLGVELIQPTPQDAYTEIQYRQLWKLLIDLSNIYGFPLDREHVLGHEQVNPQKSDPGERFDWNYLFNLVEVPMTVIDGLNIIWRKLDLIQQETLRHGANLNVIREMAEDAKQDGVVVIKKALGLQE